MTGPSIEGIGVRQAELDDVAPAGDEGACRFHGAGDVREAHGEVADQCGPALCPGLLDRVPDRVVVGAGTSSPAGLAAAERELHPLDLGLDEVGLRATPNQRAAVSTSLSPRPERLTSTIAVGAEHGVLPGWPRRARADSMAGMIPSVRQSSRNAYMASDGDGLVARPARLRQAGVLRPDSG